LNPYPRLHRPVLWTIELQPQSDWTELNRRPPGPKPGALPTELQSAEGKEARRAGVEPAWTGFGDRGSADRASAACVGAMVSGQRSELWDCLTADYEPLTKRMGREGFEPPKREAVDLQSTSFNQTWIPTREGKHKTRNIKHKTWDWTRPFYVFCFNVLCFPSDPGRTRTCDILFVGEAS
jgi:hypothetical protein